ncbi:biotin transporter BioY [Archangium violaceum]|uniref:biotin transporter BioY n=1 Tax=Archangium violaceum TaxID=83451 RepID=UPI000698BCB6|nr:biotin transporter BioY [Archangium violaceum]
MSAGTGSPPPRVLADVFARTRVHDGAFVLGAALFTALLAQVAIAVPGSPVPITGQTLAVVLTAAALGPVRGVAGQLAYVLLGAAGLPFYSKGAIQRAALTRREELLPLAAGVAASTGATFEVLGLDRALEFAVLELPYYFWQVGSQTLCPTIPAPDAPTSALFDFIQRYTYFTDSFGDAGLQSLAPYSYQAATQIGALRYAEHHLHGLLRYPRQDLPAHLPPLGVQKRFDVTAMSRVGHWVRNSGQRMLFLYGEDDPWFSVPFEVRESNDSLRFVVPRGNHGARLAQLPEPERTAALDHLFQWAGLDPSAARQGLRVPEAGTWSQEDSLEPAHRPL